MRASSYNIYVDLPDDSEHMLLVHGFMGTHDLVSKNVAMYVRSLEPIAPKPLYGVWKDDGFLTVDSERPKAETIRTLYARGYLTEKTVDEEAELYTKVANKLHTLHSSKLSYVIMPTYNCNLRCPYCFQDHMRTDSNYSHLLQKMTREMADQIIAAMDDLDTQFGWQQRENQTHPKRDILFFGGEPLLRENIETVAYFIEQLSGRGECQFSAISNATEIDTYRSLLGKNGISSIQVTIDGPPEEHDLRRKYESGAGSFAKIADNISLALDLGVYISLRMNIDKKNIDSLPKLAKIIIEKGWANYNNFSAYTSPIHPTPNTDAKTLFTSWTLTKAIDRLRSEFPEMDVIARPSDRDKLKTARIFSGKDVSNPLGHLNSTYCGAHTGMYIFDPRGDIYACWEITGDSRVRIGHHADGKVQFNEQNYAWRSRNTTTNPVCKKCRYSLYCGGGCAVLADSDHGTMFSNHCDGFQSRFRSAVAEAYADHKGSVISQKNPDVFLDKQ